MNGCLCRSQVTSLQAYSRKWMLLVCPVEPNMSACSLVSRLAGFTRCILAVWMKHSWTAGSRHLSCDSFLMETSSPDPQIWMIPFTPWALASTWLAGKTLKVCLWRTIWITNSISNNSSRWIPNLDIISWTTQWQNLCCKTLESKRVKSPGCAWSCTKNMGRPWLVWRW